LKADISPDYLRDVDQINWFRLREVYVRSSAESLCLVLNKDNRVRLLGWINLSDKDRDSLNGPLPLAYRDLEECGWHFLRRADRNSLLVLCLKDAVVPPYLAGLIDCYLLLWQVSRGF